MPLTSERLRSRHPFELFMLAASVFYSTAGLLQRQARPGSLREQVGETGTYIWLGFVLIGAVAALVGIFWKDRATGLTAEQQGLLAAGSATCFYAAVAIYVNGPSALASTAILVGFGAACLTRSWQLHRKLTGVRKGRQGVVHNQGD